MATPSPHHIPKPPRCPPRSAADPAWPWVPGALAPIGAVPRLLVGSADRAPDPSPPSRARWRSTAAPGRPPGLRRGVARRRARRRCGSSVVRPVSGRRALDPARGTRSTGRASCREAQHRLCHAWHHAHRRAHARGTSNAPDLTMSLARARQRPEVPGARDFLPVVPTLPSLRDAVSACHGCTLYREATQAVFGEGSASAHVMLIGEQPGDSEDLAGKPFVGPAGKVLDDALEVAGIPRSETYVTNVVKHFKFTRRGKRRIHDKPTRYEVEACRPWLAAELA